MRAQWYSVAPQRVRALAIAPAGNLVQMPVSVVDLPGRGRSLIATRDIPRGEVIFTEAPLVLRCIACVCSWTLRHFELNPHHRWQVSVQDTENRAKTISCASCLAFVGSLVHPSAMVWSLAPPLFPKRVVAVAGDAARPANARAHPSGSLTIGANRRSGLLRRTPHSSDVLDRRAQLKGCQSLRSVQTT